MSSKQIRPPETMKYNESKLTYITIAAVIISACVLLYLCVSLFAAVVSLALTTLMVLIILAARSG